LFTSLGALPRYFVEWKVYNKKAAAQQISFRDSYPCLADRVAATPFDVIGEQFTLRQPGP
jgi:hypothetical protein